MLPDIRPSVAPRRVLPCSLNWRSWIYCRAKLFSELPQLQGMSEQQSLFGPIYIPNQVREGFSGSPQELNVQMHVRVVLKPLRSVFK